MPEKTEPLFETPNIDCMSINPADVAALGRVFTTLARYCKCKSRAMRYRLAGHIEIALEFERQCQLLYESLPQEFRW